MILTPSNLVVKEQVDRRVLGAVALVDAITGTRVVTASELRVEGMELVNPAGPPAVNLPVDADESALRIQRNRQGDYVIIGAPRFEEYVDAFENPERPGVLRHELPGGEFVELVLRLRLGVEDAGPNHLPRIFSMDLPRGLSPEDADAVHTPLPVTLFRAPNAGLHDGWAALRVSVEQEGDPDPRVPLPGVLIEVYRLPRNPDDAPIGRGMSDWRGRARGEALVPVNGLRRFRAGQGDVVVVTSESVTVEAARDPGFTGAAGTFPDVDAISDPENEEIIRPPDRPEDSSLSSTPGLPLNLRPGQELGVHLEMP